MADGPEPTQAERIADDILAREARKAAGTEDSHAAWGDWFDVQYALCRDTTARIDKDSDGKSPAFKMGLVLAVIEHMGELARSCLVLPESDHNLPQPGPGL